MHVTLFGCRVDTRVTLVHVEAVVLSLAKVRAERLEDTPDTLLRVGQVGPQAFMHPQNNLTRQDLT
jgi:hypothetical protein